jgi:hypothetical protein
MISIEDRTAFTKAESKARQVKPLVKIIEFGTYSVAGSKEGTSYTVTFSKDNGHWQAECTCQAHIMTATPKACYHIVSAYNSHRIQVNIRKEIRAALEAVQGQAPATIERFCTCGSVIETTLAGDKCRSCLNSELFG